MFKIFMLLFIIELISFIIGIFTNKIINMYKINKIRLNKNYEELTEEEEKQIKELEEIINKYKGE